MVNWFGSPLALKGLYIFSRLKTVKETKGFGLNKQKKPSVSVSINIQVKFTIMSRRYELGGGEGW